MERYCVRISSGELVFSTAHFLVFEDGQCEPLHGHDYQVGVEVEGPLGLDEYVLDFTALYDTMREIILPLDHRVLLPNEHPNLRVDFNESEVKVVHSARQWVFPASDCVRLPLSNTTTERIAQYLGLRLQRELELKPECSIVRLQIELSEGRGRSAVWEFQAE